MRGFILFLFFVLFYWRVERGGARVADGPPTALQEQLPISMDL